MWHPNFWTGHNSKAFSFLRIPKLKIKPWTHSARCLKVRGTKIPPAAIWNESRKQRGGREKFDVAALAAKFFSCGLNDNIKPQQLAAKTHLKSNLLVFLTASYAFLWSNEWLWRQNSLVAVKRQNKGATTWGQKAFEVKFVDIFDREPSRSNREIWHSVFGGKFL